MRIASPDSKNNIIKLRIDGETDRYLKSRSSNVSEYVRKLIAEDMRKNSSVNRAF